MHHQDDQAGFPVVGTPHHPRTADVMDFVLWRKARELICHHGPRAPAKARRKAVAASCDGDADGARIWHAIAAAAERLLAQFER